jgi:hypothetical protein
MQHPLVWEEIRHLGTRGALTILTPLFRGRWGRGARIGRFYILLRVYVSSTTFPQQWTSLIDNHRLVW